MVVQFSLTNPTSGFVFVHPHDAAYADVCYADVLSVNVNLLKGGIVSFTMLIACLKLN